MYQLFSLPLFQVAGLFGGGAEMTMLVPMVAVFVIFYFLMIRPQRKKEKDRQTMIGAVKKGDKITSIGGIKGVVTSVKENTVMVKVDDNAKLEFTKAAISSVDVIKDDGGDKTAVVDDSKKEKK